MSVTAMQITAKYHVRFHLGDPFMSNTTSVALSAGYTEFEDIRPMIALRVGVNAKQVTILGLTSLPL